MHLHSGLSDLDFRTNVLVCPDLGKTVPLPIVADTKIILFSSL